MNKILIYLLIVLLSACNKNNSKIDDSKITEIYLNHRLSGFFGKSQIEITKYSENEYLYIETIHIVDSLYKKSIKEKTCKITHIQFDSIATLIKKLMKQILLSIKNLFFLMVNITN